MSNTTRRPKAPTLVEIGPNGTTPAPYRVDRHEWVCCTTPDCEGFCAEIRTAPSVQERHRFIDADDEITAYNKVWTETPEDERDEVDTPRARQLILISPFVKAWNAVGVDAVTFEDRPIPAPAIGGPDVFQLIDLAAGSWLLITISTAIRLGKPARTIDNVLRLVSATGAATTSAGRTDDRS